MTIGRIDAIGDQSTAPGTADFVIDGVALTGMLAFAGKLTDGLTYRYRAQNSDNSAWEVGGGVWTAATNTLSRVTTYQSSNGGAKTNFTGTTAIAITMTAADFGSFDAASITNTPAGNIAATDVQAAINELDTEKLAATSAGVASVLHAATAKTVLVDGDEVSGTDSANSFSLIRTVWSDVWTYIKSKADSVYAFVGAVNTFTKAQRGAFVALTDAATVALDLSLANQYRLLLGGSRTLGMPTNVVEGQQGVISIRQDATGSRTLAYAWPYVWAGGTAGVLSTPGCSRDLLAYSVDAYNSAVVTITIASPGVVTMTAHGFDTGQRVQITTTGALPTGLTASTTYFISKVDADSFKLCTTLANAAAGTFINTSGSQSGVHTLTGCSISLSLAKAFA